MVHCPRGSAPGHAIAARSAQKNARHERQPSDSQRNGATPPRQRRAPNASPAGRGTRRRSAPKNSDVGIFRDLRLGRHRFDEAACRARRSLRRRSRSSYGDQPHARCARRCCGWRRSGWSRWCRSPAPMSPAFRSRLCREALVVRRALEGVTVRAATRFASASQITGLRAIIQRQQETAAAGDRKSPSTRRRGVPRAIAAAGRYRGIWDMIAADEGPCRALPAAHASAAGPHGRVIVESIPTSSIAIGGGRPTRPRSRAWTIT